MDGKQLGETSRLLTAELAVALRVGQDTIYRGASSGRIPGWRVGRQWRFRFQEALEALGARPIAGESALDARVESS